MLARLAADSRSLSPALGLTGDTLTPCPESPNCVSSDAPGNDPHYIEPLALSDAGQWDTLIKRISTMAGATLVTLEHDYAHFTFSTPLLGFVDDVECHYRPAQSQAAIRSASRVGYGDMNINRKRVEAIRGLL